MPSTITTVVDATEVSKAIDDMIKATGTAKPLFQVIGRKLVNRIRLGFRQGQSPAGAPWLPLKFRLGQPLRDTNRLQNSIGANVGPDFVEVGTNVKYARVHQYGAEIKAQPGNAGQNSIGPRKGAPFLVFPNKALGGLVFAKSVKVPARPFLPVDNSGQVDLPGPWADDVLSAIRRHLLRQKQEA